MEYDLNTMQTDTEDAIISLLEEVVQFPLDHFSEKSLQIRLATRLLPKFSDRVRTGLEHRYAKYIRRIQEQGKRNYDLTKVLSIPPLQMEYGVNLSGPYRLDVAVLNPAEISQVCNWQLQRRCETTGTKKEFNYLKPFIGIEFGTEKTGWDKMSGSHLANDAEKVNTCSKGFIINVMRNTNLSGSTTGRYSKKEAQVERFKTAMATYAGLHDKINWIGLVLNINSYSVDVFRQDETVKWQAFYLDTQMTAYLAAIKDQVRRA